jgi:succinate--hydroxymethylglutarate CoA-transferase
VANRELMYEILDADLLARKAAPLLEQLTARKVPCAPVNGMAEVFEHPQVLHREMLQHVEHPDYGRIPTLGSPVKYTGFDISADWQAPPVLGEHNDDVLNEWLGKSGTQGKRASAS